MKSTLGVNDTWSITQESRSEEGRHTIGNNNKLMYRLCKETGATKAPVQSVVQNTRRQMHWYKTKKLQATNCIEHSVYVLVNAGPTEVYTNQDTA
jgi:hypothetical protein